MSTLPRTQTIGNVKIVPLFTGATSQLDDWIVQYLDVEVVAKSQTLVLSPQTALFLLQRFPKREKTFVFLGHGSKALSLAEMSLVKVLASLAGPDGAKPLCLLSFQAVHLHPLLAAVLRAHPQSSSLSVFVSDDQQGKEWQAAFASVSSALASPPRLHLVSLGSTGPHNTIDEIVAVRKARQLIQDHGILGGVMAGALFAFAGSQLAQESSPLLLLPDSCFSYASTLLNDTWLTEQGVLQVHSLSQYPRGAVIEDLQLPEATTIFATESVERARDVMQSRDFSQLPVVNSHRRVVGLISLDKAIELGPAHQHDQVVRHMQGFAKGTKYQVITLDTPLHELDPLFERTPAVFVTDENGKFPLAVVTKVDVLRFLAKNASII
ncbi:cystathionine beta-synthase [Kappamyces sp. JEL0680]|nr:cystathionine beta-synthase [Kappamyces sp. JEL0680]